MNNETYGISVEVFLADLFTVTVDDNYRNRANEELINSLKKHIGKHVLQDFKEENLKITEFTGENQNLHDFKLNNNFTLSVKSNIGKLGKVCPQQIGQMTSKKFYEKFLKDVNLPTDYTERKETFKQYIYDNLLEMTYNYYNALFSSDYLFYITDLDYSRPSFFLLNKLNKPSLNKNKLKLKKDLVDWQSSNQLLYDNKVLGEFQLHNNRDCFKFRFNMQTLLSLFSYKDDVVELRNEDCLVFLKSLQDNSVDLILIDPPYKISRETGFSRGVATNTEVDKLRISYEFGKWDTGRDVLYRVIKECYRVLKKHGTIICFYDLWKITKLKDWLESAGFRQLRFAEWIKTNPVPINSKLNYLTNAREIFITAVKHSKPTFNSEYDKGIYECGINQERDRFHPTQKPLKLIENILLKHSNENDLILDCFSGSGTTMIASVKNNRKFIGTELDPRYFSKSIKRYKNIKQQENLFEFLKG